MSPDGEPKEKTQEDQVHEEVELLMQALSQKPFELSSFQELLEDKNRIKSEGNTLKQLLLEVLLTKFGTHSLEHLTRGIEKIKPVILQMFQNNQDA